MDYCSRWRTGVTFLFKEDPNPGRERIIRLVSCAAAGLWRLPLLRIALIPFGPGSNSLVGAKFIWERSSPT